MASNEYVQSDFHFDGAVDMLVEDRVTGDWQVLGRLNGVEFTISTEKRTIEQVTDGFLSEKKERSKRRTAMLRATLMEASPDINQLILGEYGDTQTVVTTPTIKSFTFHKRLYAFDDYTYEHDHVGYCTLARLDPITTAAPTYVANGGSGWTTGANYAWVVPLYAGKNMKTDAANSITDITGVAIGVANNKWHGFKDVRNYYTTGTPEATGSLSVLHVGGTFRITVTQMALDDDEPLPDGWAVFQSTSNSIYGAKLDVAVANTVTRSGGVQIINLTKPAHSSSDTYAYNGTSAAQDTYGLSMRTMANYDTGTVAYAMLRYGADYDNDQVTGQYSRHASASAATDGDMLEITIWYIEAESVENKIGYGGRNADYRPVLLTAVSADDTPPSGEVTLGEGDYAILSKVNFAGLTATFNFDEENFRPGQPIEMKCLAGSDQSFGRKRMVSRKNRMYAQKFS